MVVGKDSRTYAATLEPGKTHALAVAALRRQPCRLPQSRTDYADKYAVSIRSILTLPNVYLFQLTDLFLFLGRCLLYASCCFSAFPLPPSASYRRKHETAELPYFDTPLCTIIECTTYNGVVYGNFDKKNLDIATNLNNNKLLLV